MYFNGLKITLDNEVNTVYIQFFSVFTIMYVLNKIIYRLITLLTLIKLSINFEIYLCDL